MQESVEIISQAVLIGLFYINEWMNASIHPPIKYYIYYIGESEMVWIGQQMWEEQVNLSILTVAKE